MQADPALQPRLFSELCLRCRRAVTAAFCQAEHCRRKYVPREAYSRITCPLHDRNIPEDLRPEKMREAVHCPNCDVNLYGIKPEDT